ncbi:hypothetical protein ABGT15_07720 [Flavobacterium enshiense]|uniref:hypothetical protein n=1 Tax=Flavobacterium enshiense TaxID=1341165 RepID=UPI00345CF648
MKKSIIYLGIALVAFTNVISALAQQSITNDSSTQIVQSNENLEGSTSDASSKEKNTTGVGNPVRFEPETIEVPVYQKTMAEIIAENNQIIESNMPYEQTTDENRATADTVNALIDFYPICTEKTMEEIILEGNQIIESPALNTIELLALEKPKKS